MNDFSIRKFFLPAGLMILTLALAGCGAGAQSGAAAVVTEQENPAGESAGADPGQPVSGTRMPPESRELPLAMELAMATFRLEDTETPITAEQAAEFLPLWKAVRSLNQSDTAAQQEIDALFDQIRETFTAEQLQAVAEMGLTAQDLPALAEDLGLELGGGGRFGELTAEQQATMQVARESGQVPPGGFPGGGPGGGGGLGAGPGAGEAGLSPEVRETAMAERGSSRGGLMGVNSALIDAIVTFLETRGQ